MAKIATTVQVHINAAPEVVFSWITDPSNLIYWMNGVRNAEWIRRQDAYLPRPRDSWAMLYEFDGKENEVIMEVDVCDPRDGAFEFHTIQGPYPINTEFMCRPSPKGTLVHMTRTAFSDSLLSAIMFILTGLISKPMMKKQIQLELEKMKSVAEDQLPTP